MPLSHLAIIYLIQLLLVLLPGYGISKLLAKAGVKDSWKGYVPFLNTWETQKLTGRKMHWVFWQLIPIVGWFITPALYIEFVRLFGRYSIADHTAASLAAPVYFPYLAKSKNVRYIGADMVKKHIKHWSREWFDALIFAIVAATLIRMFVFEAYVIPTSSLEKTLLVRDYLFVSKMSYGTRVPNTPLSFPFVHHTMPVIGTKSFVEWIKLPYIRWWENPVKRNDIVVFNFPFGDTSALPDDSKDPYYDKILSASYQLQYEDEKQGKAQPIANYYSRARELVRDEFKIITRPVDKRENYVKRCVAIAGDTLQIINGDLYINNQKAYIAPTAARMYKVTTEKPVSTDYFRELGIRLSGPNAGSEGDVGKISNSANVFELNLSTEEAAILRKKPECKIEEIVDTVYNETIIVNAGQRNETKLPDDAKVFPRSNLPQYQWTIDKFGPLWVPKKGATITLNEDAFIKYYRVISTYEGNEFEQIAPGRYKINGKEVKEYKFKMNYYWMMGDNRNKSQDSRYWGFVPEDHIVGKPKVIWFSWEDGPRWKRIFRMIQ